MKAEIKMNCISCGKVGLSKDEIGINKKLIGENTKNMYCLDCLADHFEVSVGDILDKIEEFKDEGCTLFK